jgi:MOSC domain-containing protein YiiM
MKVTGLYRGKLANIGAKNSPTGIYKLAVAHVAITPQGVVGDIQADKRFHGGPEKALHQYALSSYEKIIKRFPLMHNKALPGSLGENISATNMHDHIVCIGDIFRFGSTVVQVSSPRIPCWKIDEKLHQPQLHHFIATQLITGWYYRVLEPGNIKLQDTIVALDRFNPFLSIQTFMKIIQGVIVDKSTIEQAANARGLDPQWQSRLQQKL